MKNDTMTDYIRLNQNPVAGTSYTDSCLLYPGVYTYMVRALLLQSSPSGTYYNLSQGISDTAWNNNDLKVHAGATYYIMDNIVTFTNSSINATSYFWDFGDGETSTLENPVHAFLYGNYAVTLIAGNGCDTDTISIFISIVTGISEVNNPFIISIFPNPSSGKFRISFDDSMDPYAGIKIYNIMGDLVLETKNSKHKDEIDLSNHPNGIYILTITTGKEQYKQKIVIQK
jgi:PKD repeat protein